MSRTIVGAGDPKAVKRYSGYLAVDTKRQSYFGSRFMGVGEKAETPIQMLPHLENDAGDTITYDLVMQLKMKPVRGDNTLRGKEEDLKFYTDSLLIDQCRNPLLITGAAPEGARGDTPQIEKAFEVPGALPLLLPSGCWWMPPIGAPSAPSSVSHVQESRRADDGLCVLSSTL